MLRRIARGVRKSTFATANKTNRAGVQFPLTVGKMPMLPVAPDVRFISHEKTLFTGGTGFVGSWLLPYFPNATVLTRHKRVIGPTIIGDMRNCNPVGHFDTLVHAAGSRKHHNRWNEDVDGAVNVVRVAKQCDVQKILLISSGAAYGNCEYGQAKKMIERIFLASKIPTIIVRLFTFMDRRLLSDLHFAASSFFADATAGRSIVVQNPNVVRSYMHGWDMAHLIMELFHNAVHDEIFDIGSNRPVTMIELATLISWRFGVGVRNLGGTDFSSYLPFRPIEWPSRFSLLDAIESCVSWSGYRCYTSDTSRVGVS